MKTIGLFVTILLLAYAQVGLGQGDILVAPWNGGTRALSMGGTYTAHNSGFNALLGNPAGISLANSAQFTIGGRAIIMGTSDVEEDYYKDAYNATSYESKYGIHPKLLHGGMSFPINLPGFTEKIAGAVGYRAVYDIGEKYITEGKDQYGKAEDTEVTNGLINTLSFGVSTTIAERYSLGFSYNMPIVKGMKYTSEYKESYTGGSDKYDYESNYDVTGGSFLQLGGIFAITPELYVGASLMTAHEFDLEDGDYEEKLNGQVTSEGDLMDHTLEVPSLFSFGISYRAAPEFLLSAEIQNRPWEDYQADGDELDYLEKGTAYRFGFEYGSSMFLRGGFVMETLAMLDNDDEPVNIKVITGGIGYASDTMILDIGAAFAFTSFEDREYLNKRYDYVMNQLMVIASLSFLLDFGLGM